jgi:O-antigen/teichoic acid export membrane protein
LIARGLGLLIIVLSIPLTLNYLGLERYGMWMVITSLVGFMAFADLGLGLGLMTILARNSGTDADSVARDFVSSAAVMLALIAAVGGVILGASWHWIPWANVFNVSGRAAVTEAGPAMAVFLSLFLVGLPLTVVQRTQLAYQRGYIHSAWLVAGNLIGLAGLVAAVRIHAGVPWLVLSVVGAPVLGALANFGTFFGGRNPQLRPSIRLASVSKSLVLFRSGIAFFALQLGAAIAYSTGNLIVAQVLGAKHVASYSVPFQLFAVLILVVSLALEPVWPAYGEAIGRRDVAWVRSTLIRTTVGVGVLCVLVNGVLLIAAKPIVMWWTNGVVKPSPLLLSGLAVWGVVGSLGVALSIFLNAAHVVRPQVIAALTMAVLNIVLSIIFVHSFGVAGAVWGSIVAYLSTAGVMLVTVVPRTVRSLAASA